jgi:hypothetical protein
MMEYTLAADPFFDPYRRGSPSGAHQCIVRFGAGHEQSPRARGGSHSRRNRAISKARAGRLEL